MSYGKLRGITAFQNVEPTWMYYSGFVLRTSTMKLHVLIQLPDKKSEEVGAIMLDPFKKWQPTMETDVSIEHITATYEHRFSPSVRAPFEGSKVALATVRFDLNELSFVFWSRAEQPRAVTISATHDLAVLLL